MEINPSEVTKILKEQIKNFGEKAEISEVGQVLSVGDGIARIYGLDNVQAGEMVEFSDVTRTFPVSGKFTSSQKAVYEEVLKVQKEVEISIMAIDATFWVAVSFVIFFGALIYLKIPQKVTEILDKMISDIKNEIDESENRIFNLVLIEPGKSFVRVIQSIGRGIRKAEDKDSVQIWDITSSCKFAKRHLGARKKFYKEANYPYNIEKINYENPYTRR